MVVELSDRVIVEQNGSQMKYKKNVRSMDG